MSRGTLTHVFTPLQFFLYTLRCRHNVITNGVNDRPAGLEHTRSLPGSSTVLLA